MVLTHQRYVDSAATTKEQNQIFTNSTFIPPTWILSHSSLEQDPIPSFSTTSPLYLEIL